MPVSNDTNVRRSRTRSDAVHVTTTPQRSSATGTSDNTRTTGRRVRTDVLDGAGTTNTADVEGARRRGATGTATSTGPNAGVAVRVAAGPDILPGVVGSDGALFPQANGDERLQKVNALAFRDEAAAAPFEAITDTSQLVKIAGKLAELHESLRGTPASEGEALAMRETRSAALRLLNDATIRAHTLAKDGNSTAKASVTALLKTTVDVIKAEPFKDARDFSWDALISHAEAASMPEVKEARATLYPDSMPYALWPKRVQIERYVDESGSLFADNVDILKEIGFKKVKENPDGSWVFLLKKQGAKHEIEMLLKPAPPNHEKPKVAEHLGTPPPHMIEVCMHAGYGNFMDAALAAGTKGTGKGQVMCAYQCWSEGNIEKLMRNASDVQYFGTTAMTSDWYDGFMQKHIMLGILGEKSWDDIMGFKPDPANPGKKIPSGKGAIADLKRQMADDGEHAPEHWDNHYFAPNKREIFSNKLDRDRDGTIDKNDPTFNVTYPKKIDAAGGFDPVVQSIPKYALDGSNLTKCLQQLNRAVEYNHMLPKEIEAKLPWKGASWQAAGFFEPGVGDNHAFKFARKTDGTVDVQLSTRFAHSDSEDLSRMLGLELGFWLAGEADAAVKAMPAAERAKLPEPYKSAGGVPDHVKGALGIAFLERFAEQQRSFTSEDGMLDEAWAEESLLLSRYGLAGFTTAALTAEMDAMLGDHGDYLPAQFAKILELVKDVPALGAIAGREPTRVGAPFEIPAGLMIDRDSGDTDKEVASVLKQLGVTGPVIAMQPSWLRSGEPVNIVATVKAAGGKRDVISLGVGVDGKIQAAARLPLDFGAKVDAAARRVLDSLAASLGEDAGLKKAVADLYTRARATMQPFQALKSAFTEARSLIGAGASVDVSYEFSDLARAGLVTLGEVNQLKRVVSRLYPEGDNATAEKNIIGLVEKLAGRANAANAKKAYFAEVAKTGGPEGRAAGLLKALEATPARPASPASNEEVTQAVDAALSNGLLAVDQRDEVLALLLERTGGDPRSAALVAFEEMVKDKVWNDDEIKDALAAGKAALSAALAAGRSTVDGVREGLEVIHQKSAVEIDADSLLGYGLLDLRDPNLAASGKSFADALERRAAENALFEVCSDVPDARKGYFDALAANGNDRIAAGKALAQQVPGTLWLDASRLGAISKLSPDRSAELLDVLFEKAGQRRTDWIAEQLANENPTVATAYKEAIGAGKSHKDALVAALVPAAGSGELSIIDEIKSDVFVTSAQHAEVMDEVMKLRPAAELVAAVHALAQASGMQGDDRRIKAFDTKATAALAASGSVVDEVLKFLGTLRPPAGTHIGLSLHLLSGLPFEQRKAVAEAMAKVAGTTVSELAFKGTMEPFSEATAAQTGAARAAFDAAARTGDLGDALLAAWASLAEAGVSVDSDKRAKLDVLSQLGLVADARIDVLDAKAVTIVGQPATAIAALAATLGHADEAAAEAAARAALAGNGGDVAAAVRTMLAALPARSPGVDTGALVDALAPALAGAAPGDRAKLTSDIAKKAGVTIDDLRRAFVVGRIEGASSDVANVRLVAQYDRTTKSSDSGAATAEVLRVNDLMTDSHSMAALEIAKKSGLYSGAELAKLVDVDARRNAEAVG